MVKTKSGSLPGIFPTDDTPILLFFQMSRYQWRWTAGEVKFHKQDNWTRKMVSRLACFPFSVFPCLLYDETPPLTILNRLGSCPSIKCLGNSYFELETFKWRLQTTAAQTHSSTHYQKDISNLLSTDQIINVYLESFSGLYSRPILSHGIVSILVHLYQFLNHNHLRISVALAHHASLRNSLFLRNHQTLISEISLL